jgi:predicted PurR-regulated permease PerM
MDSLDTDLPTPEKSPPWARTTKIIVIIATLLLLTLAFYLFRGLVRQIVIAAIFAYVLSPLFSYIERHTPIKRSLAVLIVYLLLVVTIATLLVVLGIEIVNQVDGLINDLPSIVADLTDQLVVIASRPIVIGPFEIDLLTIDLTAVRDQIVSIVRGLLGPSSELIANLASGTVSTITTIVFIFIISIYIAIDMPRFGGLIADMATQPGYRLDAERLTGQFSRIWRAYLRGQVILALVIGVMVWASMTLLGLRNALALGVIAGLLEFLPVIGPLIAAIVAVLAALLQPDIPFSLSPFTYAMIVLAVMILIQQIENNLLVPRIVGGALDLHALIVIVGVLAGISVAGVLGAILAAPVLATIKLLGSYGWRKIFDLEPFPDPEPEPPPPSPPLHKRIARRFIRKPSS